MNMDYCKFQNTVSALNECYRDDLLVEASVFRSEEEEEARVKLLALCKEIVELADYYNN